MGKGEIACNKQFLLFPQCFLLNQIIVSPFVHIFDIISLFATEFKEPKIGIWGKGLTGVLSFSTHVLFPIDDKLCDLSHISFVTCKCFYSGQVLTHYQTTNFRLFQTERVGKRQFQIWRKWQKVIQTGKKQCGKRRNCSLTSNFSFSHSVFKRLVSQGCQKVSLCGNGLIFVGKMKDCIIHFFMLKYEYDFVFFICFAFNFQNWVRGVVCGCPTDC